MDVLYCQEWGNSNSKYLEFPSMPHYPHSSLLFEYQFQNHLTYKVAAPYVESIGRKADLGCTIARTS